MVSGEGEGKDRETATTDVLERLEGGENGVARRDDVVHEEDVFALHVFGAEKRKDTSHVFGPFVFTQACLMAVVVRADEVFGIDRNTRRVT